MPLSSQAQIIDDLTAKAAKALAAGDQFEAERCGQEALELARSDGDFRRMAAVIPTLEQARLERLDEAAGLDRVTIMDSPFEDSIVIEPGCYLFQPPLVGADARRFRLMAHGSRIGAVVLCREPRIRLGLTPLVALSSGATVRVKVHPPDDDGQPDMHWYLDALDALGEAAGEMDPEMDVEKRIDALMARLAAIPEHEGLHRQLQEACLAAADLLSADATDS